MPDEKTHADRIPIRAIWIAGGVLMLVALTSVLVGPWASSEPASRHTPAANPSAARTLTVSIPIEGMSCMICASSVKRTAQRVDGVRGVEVDLAQQRAKVSYVDGTTSPEHIAAAIARLGYKTGSPVIEKGQ